ncbi:hypothetical protein GH714_008319 [Hevea brasiliensis]|uniref:Small-subunit processome Utp12 domain-containing protein n=1 Tax=Hevea brasiliensis TaxID=3981 RepID=A0A6A6MYE4_HEVBR|nr:hypothetical protein GH714_008319 [Hevea brasiliensis]
MVVQCGLLLPIPNENGFITGSADHDVKFWECQVKQKPGQIFFVDTLKFFLSLYGHKLPALCMDISSDGDLIVAGSADKNLKSWGLDFGDCHKSLFALADSVGKDRLVKYWDADKFELLLTLKGHHADFGVLQSATMEKKTRGRVAEFQPKPILHGLAASDYVLRAISNVQTNDLEQTLLALPFSDALKVLSFLKDWASNPDKVELVCRIATVILQTHHDHLVTTPAARSVLTLLKRFLGNGIR